MTSRVRNRGRGYASSRGGFRDSISNYRSSPYPSKSRDESNLDERRRESYSSSRERDNMENRHRDSYSSRGSSRGGIDRNKDSYISRGSRETISRGSRDTISGRESRGSYASRGRDSYSSRNVKDEDEDRYSYSSRGKDSMPYRGGGNDSFPSRGREGFSSRGNREGFSRGGREGFSRGRREGFSARGGREGFSSRGGRDGFSSRGGRDGFPSRGGRDGFPSRGGRDGFPSRGGRDGFPSRGGRDGFPSRGSRDGFPSRGSRDGFSSRGSRDGFSSRGNREGFSSRGGREGFSSRGGRDGFSSRGGRDGFSSRGGREGFSNRGREGFSSRGGRESFLSGGGKESLSSRGRREPYNSRGSKESYPLRGGGRGFRGSLHSQRTPKPDFISHLGSQAQLELTKKLVESVLKSEEGNEERSSYREDKIHPYHDRPLKRESRGLLIRDSERPSFREQRSFIDSTVSHDEKHIKKGSSRHIEDERSLYSGRSKIRSDKYGSSGKRLLELDDDDGPALKHQRLSESDSSKRRLIKEERESRNVQSQRCERKSSTREEICSKRSSQDHDKGKVREKSSSKTRSSEKVKYVDRDKRSGERSRSKGEVDKLEDREKEIEKEGSDTSDTMDEFHENGSTERKKSWKKDKFSHSERDAYRVARDTSPSGVQVTIRSDGERAVNSDGHVKSRISGKLFVDLQCPHCPGQRSITFKEYRFHLDSDNHSIKIEKLAHKHSIVLRRIRLQQRNEQKEIEEKWEKENPEEFLTAISRYCKNCKLAFKCLPEDNATKGISMHNNSKLHKVQQHYLFPRCTMCRMSFPSRMVYEYHIASIRHLRMRAVCYENGLHGSQDKKNEKEVEGGDLDLTNFITMDSVGEDEDVGSEHDEITGKLEDIEAAEEDAKVGEEEEEDDETRGNKETIHNDKKTNRTALLDDEEEDHIELDLVNDGSLTEQIGEGEICGKDYVFPIEASYCKLCNKVIRTDSHLGLEAIDRHCLSAAHLDNYHYLESEDFLDEHGEDLEDGDEENEQHPHSNGEEEFFEDEGEDLPHGEEEVGDEGHDFSNEEELYDEEENFPDEDHVEDEIEAHREEEEEEAEGEEHKGKEGKNGDENEKNATEDAELEATKHDDGEAIMEEDLLEFHSGEEKGKTADNSETEELM